METPGLCVLTLMHRRLAGFEVWVGNDAIAPASNTLCGGSTTTPGASITVQCDRGVTSGQFVFVTIPGDSKLLTLCEVGVMAESAESIVCYDGFKYKTQACAAGQCTGFERLTLVAFNTHQLPPGTPSSAGPGPTQCTGCDETAALVPWRNDATEGTCQTYTTKMQIRDIPGSSLFSLCGTGVCVLHASVLMILHGCRHRV